MITAPVESQIAREAALEQELEQYRLQAEELLKVISKRDSEIVALRHQIEQLLRRLYGQRSERFNPDQLLLDGIIENLPDEAKADPEQIRVKHIIKKRKAKPTGRLEIPEHLEVEKVLLDVPEEKKVDPETGEKLVHVRDEVTRRLAFKPARLYAIHYVRPIYASPSKSSDCGIVVAELPEGIIDKCKADESLIAHLIVSKYLDHQPLYRLEQIFLREGIQMARSTMCNWTVESLLTLDLLYETIKTAVLGQPILFTDDTPVDVLSPGSGKTKTGRVWVYVSGTGPPYRVYDFSMDRKKEHPQDYLRDFKGFIHADAYGGYDQIFT